MTEHKEVCLGTNSAQSIRLRKGTNEVKNYFKQLPVPLKVYSGFASNLKRVESYDGFYSKKYQDQIPCSFGYKHNCVDDRFIKQIVVFRGKDAAYIFIEAIPKKYEYCKKVIKKHFNKNAIMTEEEGENFQSSNTCWICEKLIDDEKVRGHCHVTGKFIGGACWSCNINLQLTKKVPVIFCNLIGYDNLYCI